MGSRGAVGPRWAAEVFFLYRACVPLVVFCSSSCLHINPKPSCLFVTTSLACAKECRVAVKACGWLRYESLYAKHVHVPTWWPRRIQCAPQKRKPLLYVTKRHHGKEASRDEEEPKQETQKGTHDEARLAHQHRPTTQDQSPAAVHSICHHAILRLLVPSSTADDQEQLYLSSQPSPQDTLRNV